MSMTKALALVSLFAACAHDSGSTGGASGSATPQEVPAGKYALTLKLNPGEVRRYEIEVNFHYKALMNDAPVFDAPITVKLTEVLETGPRAADGTTSLKERFENLDIKTKGQGEMLKPLLLDLTKIVVISNVRADGSLASSKTEGVAGNEILEGMTKQIAQGARFFFLPKIPVGPGDTWTADEKTPINVGRSGKVEATVKSTLKFVGIEPCGAKQCARVETDSETNVPESASAELSGGGKGRSTFMIEIDDGRPWKSKDEQEFKFQTSQQGQPIDITSKVSYTSELK